MTYETTTPTRPNWVYRIGESIVPFATTFGLFAAVLAWGVLDMYNDGLAAIGAIDGVNVTFLAILATLFVAPIVLGGHAVLRRWLSPRRAWAALAVLGGIVGLAFIVQSTLDAAPPLSMWGRAEVVETLAFTAIVGLGVAIALAGPAIGVWLRRRSLPTDRRAWLVGGVVLLVLFAAPYGVGAVVDDNGGNDGYDPGGGWNGTVDEYEDQWNQTNDSTGAENSTGDETDSAAAAELTLGEIRCSETPDDVRATPDFNHSVATNGTFADDLRVEHVDFGDGGHIYSFAQWNDSEVVEAAADGAAPDSAYAVDYVGTVDLAVSGDTPARLWIDVVNDDGAVVRYQVDVCPPPEDSSAE